MSPLRDWIGKKGPFVPRLSRLSAASKAASFAARSHTDQPQTLYPQGFAGRQGGFSAV
jgi:hypothetical protein